MIADFRFKSQRFQFAIQNLQSEIVQAKDAKNHNHFVRTMSQLFQIYDSRLQI